MCADLGSLGNTTRFVTPPSQKGASGAVAKTQYDAKAARILRYELQTVARDLLPGDRIGVCLRRLGFDRHSVEIWVSERFHQAHLKGLVVCGSVWTCPVCAAKITERRRAEISEALARARIKGLAVVMITVTLQHKRGAALGDLLRVLADAWRRVQQGSAWVRIKKRFGLIKPISGLETTWGAANGWHPHKHILYFCKAGQVDHAALEAAISERWRSELAELGHYASGLYGVKVQVGDDKAADYVSKWGLDFELAKSPVKKGRAGGYSPFQLLQLARDGQAWAGDLFREYAAAMNGRKQLHWSPGLRDLLGLSQEKTDSELANQGIEASYLFAHLTWKQYQVVLRCAGQGRRGVVGEMLEVAGRGDVVAFWAFLESLGIVSKPDQVIQSKYPWLDPRNIVGSKPKRQRIEPAADLSADDLASLDSSCSIPDAELLARQKRIERGKEFFSGPDYYAAERNRILDWDKLSARIDIKIAAGQRTREAESS